MESKLSLPRPKASIKGAAGQTRKGKLVRRRSALSFFLSFFLSSSRSAAQGDAVAGATGSMGWADPTLADGRAAEAAGRAGHPGAALAALVAAAEVSAAVARVGVGKK